MANTQLKQSVGAADASPLIGRVLDACTSASGVATVGDFLTAVERVASRERQLSSATAWNSVVRAYADLVKRTAPPVVQPVDASRSLKAAFRRARELRLNIGGRDRFIGLRHVLAAIVTARGGASQSELRIYLAESGVPLQLFRDALLRDVLSAPEPQESPDRWRQVFGSPSTPETSPSAQAAAAIVGGGPDGQTVPEPETADTGRSAPTTVSEHQRPDDGPTDFSESSTQAAADARPVSSRTVFAITGADDPNHPELRDRTGADREAEAFAMLATAREFVPPVAFGVFGEWGAGKSFFLRLIMDHVARLSSEADDRSPFHKDVVPIVFNAWHYAETNLWASLVDHIFSKLDQWSVADQPTSSLLDNLLSSRSFTLEAAEAVVETRREQHAAAALLTEAEAAQASAEQDALARIRQITSGAWEAMWSDGEGRAVPKKEIEKAAQQLGLTEATASVEGAAKALQQLDAEIAGLGFVRGPYLRTAMSAGLLICCAIGVVLLPPLIAWVTNLVAGPAAAFVAAVSGFAAPLALGAAWVRVTAKMAVEQIGKLRPLVDATQAEIKRRRQEELSPQRTELADKTAIADEARARLQVATDRLAQASSDYAAGTGRARLLNFVRERVTADSYGKHLSFVATIRRDFEALSNLMTDASASDLEAQTAASRHNKAVEELIARSANLLTPEETDRLRATTKSDVSQGRSFERIILYIDDLDRCPPEKVMEVLQAIHLLLAFKLFVVFVAVDVRWLENALTTKYGNAFGDEASPSLATPYDYLEKIFQIPYWVRRLNAGNVADVLADRLAPNFSDGGTPPTLPVAPSLENIATRSDQAESGSVEPAVGQSAVSGSDETPLPLRISRAEADYMTQLAPALDVSPRRVLRFLNSYSLIKASLAPEERGRLETGFFRPVLSLLAIAVLDDKTAGILFRSLSSTGSRSTLEVGAGESRHSQAVALALAVIPSEVDISDIQEASKLVMRFTFCGDLK